MLLELRRRKSDEFCTIGDLYVNRVLFCQTLEDVVRRVKIPNATAIPAGEYIIELDWSGRFQRVMPHLIGVSGFEGIRIHSGNVAADTSGCILVGVLDSTHPDMVINSRATYAKLYPMLESAFGREVVCISISNYAENQFND